jgi:dynactin complex subunit
MARDRMQYIGRVPEIGKGYWIGVEFETPEGKHDGSIGTATYFQAKHAHGSFVRPDHIRRVGGAPGTTPGAVTGAIKDSSTSPSPKAKPNLKLKGGAVMGTPPLA